MVLLIALGSLFAYFNSASVNPVTGEKQHVGNITPDQEIALGLEAAPQMADQFGGLTRNARLQADVDEVGQRLVTETEAGRSPYRFQFHVLADRETVNAFALPGGQIFITEALLGRLQTEGQLAGVLGHEIGHVIARHGAQQMAKQQLMQGLAGAAVIATADPSNPNGGQSAQLAMAIGQMINMKYGREDELESDRYGVKYTAGAGYDPHAMIEVMDILEQASGGKGPAEFMSTHPSPENRRGRIKEAIKELFPNGLPRGLQR